MTCLFVVMVVVGSGSGGAELRVESDKAIVPGYSINT